MRPYSILHDVITKTIHPPIGGIVAEKATTTKTFKKVFQSSKLNLYIWRPIPPPGFVCMGDVASGSNVIPLFSVVCIPESWVKECPIGSRLFSSLKGGDDFKTHSFSIWEVSNNTGAFFGAPSINKMLPESSELPEKVEYTGVAKGYQFITKITNYLYGEWDMSRPILSQSSLSWTKTILEALLDNKYSRKFLFTEDLYLKLVRFLFSSSSPNVFLIVPILITMIRVSEEEMFNFSFESKLGCLSETFLAVTEPFKFDLANLNLRDGYSALMDLVVELLRLENRKDKLLDDTPDSIFKESSPHSPLNGLLHWTASTYDTEQSNKKTSKLFSPAKTFDILVDDQFEKSFTDSSNLKRSKSYKWWDRKKLFIESDPFIKKNILEDEENNINKLRHVLAFFETINTNNSSKDIYSFIPVNYSSKLAKIWLDHISRCAFEESTHPLNRDSKPSSSTFYKEFHFPGALKMHVSFDRRCSLLKGCKLSFTSSTSTKIFTHLTTKEEWAKGLNIGSDNLKVSLENVSEDEPGKVEEEMWGWSFLLYAQGTLYENLSLEVKLRETSTIESPQKQVFFYLAFFFSIILLLIYILLVKKIF